MSKATRNGELACTLGRQATLKGVDFSLTRRPGCRKFLDGKQNGVKSKAKQSTLAFNQKPAERAAVKETGSSADDAEALDVEMREVLGQTTTNGMKADGVQVASSAKSSSPANRLKREQDNHQDEDYEDDSDDQPVVKRRKRSSETPKTTKPAPATSSRKTASYKVFKAQEETKSKAGRLPKSEATPITRAEKDPGEVATPEGEESAPEGEESAPEGQESAPQGEESASEDEVKSDSEEEEKPQVAAKKRETLQTTLQNSGKDPYPDWKAGDPVPYAALCATFSLIEMTTKRLQISAHCSLFLQQVLRLTPNDLLPTVQLMINKVAADYAGIELGIGESLIIKAISESTGRPLSVTKADHQKIGDLGLVAAKSRSTQGTMFKPKPLTVRGVHEGLLAIAKMEGHGSQDKKVGAIKKLLAAADVVAGTKGIDISKDKGGPSESKFIVRFLEGKLRLGLAEKTVIVALAQAMVTHEVAQRGNKLPTSEQLATGESTLKLVYR